jgi:hypothetical protein
MDGVFPTFGTRPYRLQTQPIGLNKIWDKSTHAFGPCMWWSYRILPGYTGTTGQADLLRNPTQSGFFRKTLGSL